MVLQVRLESNTTLHLAEVESEVRNTNHPHSATKKICPSKTRAKHLKAEFALKKSPRPASYTPKPKPPTKTEKKKASFTKHNVKQAQKFGNKSAQKTSKAAKQKAQRNENWDKAHPRKKDDSSANQGLGWTW
jgi:hypothetical protein